MECVKSETSTTGVPAAKAPVAEAVEAEAAKGDSADADKADADRAPDTSAPDACDPSVPGTCDASALDTSPSDPSGGIVEVDSLGISTAFSTDLVECAADKAASATAVPASFAAASAVGC